MPNDGEADRSVRIVGANAQADESVFVVNNLVVAGTPSPGDVPVVQGDGSLAWGAGGGGGGGAGSPVVRKFPFAFNTPGLLTGHAVYTPTIGDILLDAWIEIDTAWNGTTPRADIGTFVGSTTGLFDWSIPSDPSGIDLALVANAPAGAGVQIGRGLSRRMTFSRSSTTVACRQSLRLPTRSRSLFHSPGRWVAQTPPQPLAQRFCT